MRPAAQQRYRLLLQRERLYFLLFLQPGLPMWLSEKSGTAQKEYKVQLRHLLIKKKTP